jgi:L-fuculose-phosphate aldolase
MFERKISDLAGGNISMRVDDHVLITPSLASARKFWQLKPEEILILDCNGNLLEGEGKVSRELVTHLALLNAFYPTGKAVVHAHPPNVLVFCAANQTIPPVLECTVKFGEIKLAKYAHGGTQSQELAQNVLAELRGQEERVAKQAAAVLAPWHGIFAIGKDLNATLDAVERIETNARCILMSRLLMQKDTPLDMQREALYTAIESADAIGE